MSNKEPNVVKGLDLTRYMGRWYEIASFPSFFQRSDDVDTRATYTLNNDGTVKVLNETWSGGDRRSIEGTAYKADPNSNEAKFKVKFTIIFLPVEGDYWVLYIDDDYQYALVGDPHRNYLWILCRSTHMDDKIYNQLVKKATDEGYKDVMSKLRKTHHRN